MALPDQDGTVSATTLRPPWAVSLDKLVLRNRRLRGLLLDCYRLLQDPGPAEDQLDRRARLAARIREACAE